MLSDALAIAGGMSSQGSKSQETLSADFMSLPLELKTAIVRACEPADIAVLGQLATHISSIVADEMAAQTSSEMRSITLLVLYSSVDLSCHRDEGTFASGLTVVESDNPLRVERDGRVDQIIRRQLAFVRTILAHPEYALLIKSLAWTFLNLLDESHNGEEVKERPVWKCFKAMRNVEILDFCSLAMSREVHTPPPLFSSAKKISLGGLMSFAMASSILHSGNPEFITFLELNDVQDHGQLRKGKSLLGNEKPSVLRETMYPNKTPKIRHPGPMRDHLRILTGKCLSLKTLILRSVRQDYIACNFWWSPLDEIRYKQWAAFVDSVRNTLRTFEFEQGLPARYHIPGGCTYGHRQLPRQSIRPMDDRYLRYIAPVLFHGSWPELKDVVIRGVGGSVQDHFVDCNNGGDFWRIAESQHRLQQALEPNVLLTLEQEATKTF